MGWSCSSSDFLSVYHDYLHGLMETRVCWLVALGNPDFPWLRSQSCWLQAIKPEQLPGVGWPCCRRPALVVREEGEQEMSNVKAMWRQELLQPRAEHTGGRPRQTGVGTGTGVQLAWGPGPVRRAALVGEEGAHTAANHAVRPWAPGLYSRPAPPNRPLCADTDPSHAPAQQPPATWAPTTPHGEPEN